MGEVNPDASKPSNEERLKGVESVEAGMMFEAKSPDGKTQQIMVKKVEGDEVTIDINHPLAGVALNFDIQIVGVRGSHERRTRPWAYHEDGHSH